MAFLKVAVVVVWAMLSTLSGITSPRPPHAEITRSEEMQGICESCEYHEVVAQSQEDAKPEPKPFIGGLIEGATNLVGGVKNVAGNVVGGAVNAAGNVIGGAVNGAGNIVGGVLKGVANLATGIINGAAVVLGGVSGPKLTCTWREGTLGNGVAFAVGILTGDQCAQKCYKLSQQKGYGNINGAHVLWSTINGASVQHSDRMCYCQYRLTALNPNQYVTSCAFQQAGGHKDAKVAKEKAFGDTTEEFDWRDGKVAQEKAFDYAKEEFDVEMKKEDEGSDSSTM